MTDRHAGTAGPLRAGRLPGRALRRELQRRNTGPPTDDSGGRRGHSVLRWIWRGLIGLLVVVVVAPVVGYLWLRTSVPDYDSTVRLPGIESPVQVMRDAQAVPHIFAANDSDAYFALGYLHAQDRLWQMHMQRRIGAGRLSELFGSGFLPVDRFMRLIGLYRLAGASYEWLSPDVKRALDAYAAGVNAWLDSRSGALPPEFYMLQTWPEPWTPADSLIWGKLMALQLSGDYRTELLRAEIAAALGPAALDDLFPDRGGDGLATLTGLLPRGAAGALRAALPAPLGPATASNEWAVAPSQTETGGAILANDPHLALNAPILWYLARIKTPTLSVTGATVPGVPFTVLGHNDTIAWGMTTTGSDVQDLFIERVDPLDRDRYMTPDGTLPFTTRQEVIEVHGDEPETLIVRETRHGPVLSDIDPGVAALIGEDHVIALAFTSLIAEDTTSEALYLLARSSNWVEFLGALQFWVGPQQNIVYADVEGNIGLIVPGRIPILLDGDGRAPVPGWSGAHDWTGFIPVEELPQMLNPPVGRIVNANNRVVGPDYPHLIGHGYDAPYRAGRIAEALEAGGRQTIDDTLALQMDTVSLAARDLLPLMLLVRVDNARAAEALAMMRRWTFEMDRDRPKPLIFTMWLRELNRALYADELDDLFVDYWQLRPDVVRRMLTEARYWCDDRTTAGTETCGDILRQSLEAALTALAGAHGDDMEDWRWGDVHVAPLAHQVLGRIPVARALVDLSIETDGGAFTLNRGASQISDPDAPFSHNHGAGLRAVYDLADLANSRFMIATGQSGNPFSDGYGDLVERWRDGDSFPIGGSPSELARSGVTTLTIHPAE